MSLARTSSRMRMSLRPLRVMVVSLRRLQAHFLEIRVQTTMAARSPQLRLRPIHVQLKVLPPGPMLRAVAR
jgi:hypothetical protein